jgi:hypothetical protein
MLTLATFVWHKTAKSFKKVLKMAFDSKITKSNEKNYFQNSETDKWCYFNSKIAHSVNIPESAKMDILYYFWAQKLAKI